MNTILSKKSTPVYSIENLTQFPLNPYREFVYYCTTSVFPNIETPINMSLKDFNAKTDAERKAVIDGIINSIPGLAIEYAEKTSHPRIFLEGNITCKGSKFATIQFFTHMTYVSSSSQSDIDAEYVACELNFTEFDGFDFAGVQRTDNILDFSKDDTDTESMDMLRAHLEGLANFTEFIKAYKAKSLITKNINLFSDKLIKPYVSDIQTAFSPEHFLIGVICGEAIHKMNYPYDGYLNSIKAFAEAIKNKYGDKYKVENDEKLKKAE